MTSTTIAYVHVKTASLGSEQSHPLHCTLFYLFIFFTHLDYFVFLLLLFMDAALGSELNNSKMTERINSDSYAHHYT